MVIYAAASQETIQTGEDELTPTTIRDALETKAAAGEKIWIKADAAFPISTSITLSAVGTAASPITVEVYQTTPGDRAARLQVNASTNSFEAILVQGAFWNIIGINVDGARRGFDVSSAGDGFRIVDSYISNSDAEGVRTLSDTGTRGFLLNVQCVNGNSHGFFLQRRAQTLVNCHAINNAGTGFVIATTNYGANMMNCVSSHNSIGVDVEDYAAVIVNCNFNRNTNQGVLLASDNQSGGPHLIAGCAITDNGTGIAGGSAGIPVLLQNCLIHGNSTKTTNLSILSEVGEVTTDPLFTDEDPATETDVDLSPQDSSPLMDAGIGAPAPLSEYVGAIGFPFSRQNQSAGNSLALVVGQQ